MMADMTQGASRPRHPAAATISPLGRRDKQRGRLSHTRPSFLCSSQESSMPKALGMKDSLSSNRGSLTAQKRPGWIPVTCTGMRASSVLGSNERRDLGGQI